MPERWDIVVPVADGGTATLTTDFRVDITLEGPPGVKGDQGVPGTPAPTPLTYTLTSVSSWSQSHSFGYPPAVRIIDATGTEVFADVTYPDATHVALSFPSPFTGSVVLS